jgi:hypothetical protein
VRDDFSLGVKEVLAKRVGFRCSNPECRQLTAGPQADPTKAVNIGVAAHITAASPDGPRFDPSLTPEQRRSPENGIWLCQNHGKLVDNDAIKYSVILLREWKRIAEAMTERELVNPQGVSDRTGAAVAKAERMMPALIAEMRADLRENPLRREFVVLKRAWSYWAKGNELVYFYDDHQELDSEVQVLASLGLIREITYNNVNRFLFAEDFVEYLSVASSAGSSA